MNAAVGSLGPSPGQAEPDGRRLDLTSWQLPERFVVECRAVGAALRADRAPRSSCVVALTASRAGTGVTTLAWCLARYLAQGSGESVLLVDVVPASRAARAPGTVGFSDVLAGAATLDQAVRPTTDERLAYLPAGAASDVADAQGIGTLFSDLRARYTYVIVDVPHVLASGFAEDVVQAADSAILVVEPAADTVDVVEKAVSILRKITRVLGVVFNRADGA